MTRQKRTIIMALLPLLTIISYVHGQSLQTHNITNEIDSFEESVVTAMLRIVDEKFDSLSTRMTSLERALTSLQYYNLRQFRIVNTHLHALDTLLQAIHGRVGQQDVTNKELATSVSLLKREMKNMGLQNKESFDNIETDIVHLNKDLTQKISFAEESVINFMNKTNGGYVPSYDFSPILNDEKENKTVEYLNTLNRIEDKVDNLSNFTAQVFQNLTTETNTENENKTERNILMKSLIELNGNVRESIAFYRHTGDLVERIVGATETVADDQDRIREDIKLFMEVQTNNTAKCGKKVTESQRSAIHDGEISNEISPVVENFPGKTDDKSKVESESAQLILDEIINISNTTTKAVEMLHDLAKMNQESTKSSIVNLENEVSKLREIREHSENITHHPNLLTGLAEFNLEELSNTSKAIYTMVEAIASNTGWIPYIFHNLQFVEVQVNQTLLTSKAALKRAILHDTIQAKVSVQYEPKVTAAPPVSESVATSASCEKTDYVNDTSSLVKELRFVHKTNQRIHRLIPALTKLLGEPEPFFTLVDGDSDNQGRIEVYRRGYWGTICDPLSHVQASYICRHLGYLGGVAADPGYFGPGTGGFWRVNYTCLFSSQCEAAVMVVDDDRCNHDNDMGVICDHMVRLRYETNEEESIQRNSGFVQIYHDGKWTPVCSDNWTSENTRVVCRQLGYTTGQNRNITDDVTITQYPIKSEITYINANCTGEEKRLDTCSNGYWSKLGCVSKEPIFLDCS
ncbi:hypothetical protein FSP39_001454 [Pinctada imbricata]|uniref:SRCR domain-containing protein n=1 Tax=Pinctada imbricata TaxID=66713 RepID=A0AA89BS87_PINIB|nr:hypothetical protein FSP39_001454 [Pinctada imbricata]